MRISVITGVVAVAVRPDALAVRESLRLRAIIVVSGVVLLLRSRRHVVLRVRFVHQENDD